MRKSKVFDGSEPRLALYSCLFHTFAIFEKSRKINGKRESQGRAFWYKKGVLGVTGPIDSVIFEVLLRSKHHGSFGIDLGRQNCIKIA